jgi:hypothetical protein
MVATLNLAADQCHAALSHITCTASAERDMHEFGVPPSSLKPFEDAERGVRFVSERQRPSGGGGERAVPDALSTQKTVYSTGLFQELFVLTGGDVEPIPGELG